MRALTVFVSIIVNPYNKYVLASLLTSDLVRYVPSETPNSHYEAHLDRETRLSEYRSKYVASKNDPKRKNLL